MARPARIYVPLDVAFLDDDKVIAAGERATYLYVAILLRIKMLDTDGIITRAQVGRIGVRGWQPRLVKLVTVGLVLSEDHETFVVPAWSKWNELARERAVRHAKDRERKARDRALTSGNTFDSARNPSGIRADSVLKQASKQARHGNPPQPPPVKDVLRRIHDPEASA